MATGENRFAPDLNEKEVIELLENATPESIKKATNYGVKTFQGKNFKTLFWQFKHPMQVETIFTLKNYLYIETFAFL